MYTQGNVGVGTASPAAMLHVAGTARFDGAVTLAPTVRTLTIPAPAFEALGAAPTTLAGGTIPGLARSGSGTAQAWAPVQLPHGAVVTEMAATMYDDSNANIEVRLHGTGFSSPGGPSVQMASILSVGATGFQQQSDATIDSPMIDNAANFYFLFCKFDAEPADKALTLYAVRITYTVTAPLP